MKSLFDDPWPLSGRLHVYALPDDQLRDALVSYQSILDGVDFCVPQPRDFLHATVQQYPDFVSQVEPADLEALQNELARQAARLEPFTLHFRGPVVHKRAITADADATEEWDRLLYAVRTSAARTICTEDDLGKPPFRPHMSVGYARAEGDGDPLAKALVELGRPLDHDLLIDRIHLLAVNMHPAEGTFDWETVATFQLG